jgi:hypothetical protein
MNRLSEMRELPAHKNVVYTNADLLSVCLQPSEIFYYTRDH